MMLKFLIAFMSAVLQVLRLVVQSRDELIMENLALRQQRSVLNREHLRYTWWIGTLYPIWGM